MKAVIQNPKRRKKTVKKKNPTLKKRGSPSFQLSTKTYGMTYDGIPHVQHYIFKILSALKSGYKVNFDKDDISDIQDIYDILNRS